MLFNPGCVIMRLCRSSGQHQRMISEKCFCLSWPSHNGLKLFLWPAFVELKLCLAFRVHNVLMLSQCRAACSVHRNENDSSKHDQLRDKCVYVFTQCESSSGLQGNWTKHNDCPLRQKPLSAPQGSVLKRKNTHKHSYTLTSTENTSHHVVLKLLCVCMCC